MSDLSSVVVPTHIHTLSRQSVGTSLRQAAGASGLTAASWINNLACYLPLYLPWPYNVRRAFWVNGTPTGNVDIGIYSANGSRIWSSGSTAAAGASNSPQYVAPSPDILLTPGPYMLGFAYSSSGSFSEYTVGITGASSRDAGVYSQASAFPLPASAVLATWPYSIVPIIGITNTDSGF